MFQYDIKTKWMKSQRTINWTIEKLTEKFTTQGPVFEINGDNWHLELENDGTYFFVQVYRSLLDYNAYLEYDINLKNSAGISVSKYSCECKYLEATMADELNKKENTSRRIADWNIGDFRLDQDTFTISINLSFRRLHTDIFDRCMKEDFEELAIKSLSEGALALHDYDILHDITLHANQEKLRVHKFILRARSPVFAEKLKEYKEIDYSINDVGMPALKVMVDYMYSRVHFDLDFDSCLSVYQAADKYQMSDMQDCYRTIMFRELKPVNAGRLLKLADQYNDSDLKTAVLEFIRSYYIGCRNQNFSEDVGGKESKLYKEVLQYLDVENY